MRYQVLIPPSPVDPRDEEFPSADDLYRVLPVAGVHPTERAAASMVRDRFPDAAGMPMVVDLGSGQVMLLGFVADPERPIDPDDAIPFACFVRVLADTDADRVYLAKLQKMGNSPFKRELWKIPVHKPELARRMRVDLRSTDLEVPAFVEMSVGSHEGHLTLHAEIGEFQMSIRFADPRVQVVVASSAGLSMNPDNSPDNSPNHVPGASESPATVPLDGPVNPTDLAAIRGGEL